MKKGVAAVLVGFLMAAGFGACSSGGGGGANQGPPPVRKWTYMVYMGADNNLSQAGLEDLNEMEAVGSTSDVSVVVQAEFSTRYTADMPSSEARRI